MMKKSTVLLLKKIDKIEKDRAVADYAQSIREFNNANAVLESQEKNMRDELSCEHEVEGNLNGAQFVSAWRYLLKERMSVQRLEIESCSSSMELSRVKLQQAIKKSSRYDHLV